MVVNNSNLEAFKMRVFGRRNDKPNVVIKGTNIEVIIESPYWLTQNFIKSSNVSRITGFRKYTDRVEFRIKGVYDIHNTNTSVLNSITHFYDNDNLCTYLGNDGLVAPNLEDVKLEGVTNFGGGGFNKISKTKLTRLYLPSLTTGNGNLSLVSNAELLEFIAPKMLNIVANENAFMSACGKLKLFDAKKVKNLGTGNIVEGTFKNTGEIDNCIYKINIACKTNNSGKGLKYDFDAAIKHPLFERGATFELYDDNENFIEILSLTPNLYIKGTTSVNTNAKVREKITSCLFTNLTYSGGITQLYVDSYGSFQNAFLNDTSITEFKDLTGFIVGVNASSFNNVFNGATNLEIVEMPKLKWLGGNSFAYTKIKTLTFNELENITSQAFQNMSYVEYISIATLVNTVGISNLFANCTSLKEANAPLINTLHTSAYYNTTALEKALHDNVTQLGTTIFYKCSSIKAISLKRAKILGTGVQANNIFFEIGRRCTIDINIATDTTNGGSTDGNLMYAWLERDAIVKFYDDTLTYVKTLSRPTNINIKGIGLQFPEKVEFRTYVGLNRNMRFGSYTVTGNDVDFYLDTAVKLSSTFENNENITEFISTGGKLTQTTWEDLNSTFKNATNLRVYNVPETTNVGVDVFLNTKIETLDLPNVINIQSTSFSSMLLVKTINLPKLVTLNTGNSRSFYNCPLLEEVTAPKITFMTDSFYYDCIGLKRAIHNEVTNMIGVGRQFYNCQSIERIELKKCKGIGTENTDSNVFYNIKLGCQIHTNIYNKTSNNGAMNANLEYAKTQRNAVIYFYDDNLNLVETL